MPDTLSKSTTPGGASPLREPTREDDIGLPLRWNAVTITLLGFALAAAVSLPALRGPDRDISVLRSLWDFAGRFFPPDLTILPSVFSALVETAQIAVMATIFSVVISLPLGLASSPSLSPRGVVFVARHLLNAVRTIPSLIWALIGVAAVGPYPLAGVIGLTFYSVGYLGKFFADAFESADLAVPRALRTMGASRIQAFQYGLLPHARPLLLSHALWMLEYNVRSAAIIGYVGAGGIGTLLHAYMEYYQLQRFGTVLLVIFVVVVLLDFFGEWVRRQLTGEPRPAPSAPAAA